MSYVLLALSSVTIRTHGSSETGTLSLECVYEPSLVDKAVDTSDSELSLALHLNSLTCILQRGKIVSLVIAPSGQRIYSFEGLCNSNGGSPTGNGKKMQTVRVVIPPPSAGSTLVAEDIETFDHLLLQYAELAWSYGDPESVSSTPPPLPARPSRPTTPHPNIMSSVEGAQPVNDPSLHGKLVLMDESNGEVVGQLPQSLSITEDPALNGGTTAPVVLEMHPDMYDACTGAKRLEDIGEDLLETRQVFARAVPAEEQDWIMKSATLVSQAISGSTSLLLSGITAASNFYIAHSAPGSSKSSSKSPTPSHSGAASPTSPGSPTQQSVQNAALSKAYALSGHARAASAKTVDAVEGVIRRAVGAKPNPNSRYTPPSLTPSGPSEVSYSAPPAYAVYTPKRRPRTLSNKETIVVESGEEDDEDQEEQERKPLGTGAKLLLSANLVLTTVDDSARRMFDVTTDRIGAVVGHKFGADAQRTTHLASHTARNIVLVYVDVRGFARRALITKTGKEFVKARFSGKDKGKGTSAPNSGASTPRSPSHTPVPTPALPSAAAPGQKA